MKQFKSEPIEMDYIIAEEIGSGQFATVRRCIERSSGKEFAAKFVRKKRIIGSRRGLLLEDIEREVNILKKLNHDNIVKLFNVYDNGNEVILILELVKGGELFDYLAGKEGLEETQAIAFIKQILLGLDHMHSKNIVHLDLKPENIMLLDKETQRLKLIDFGLSRVVNTGSDIREILGTPEFVAPEIINYEPITLATDLWSVGVITYNLLSGASPFLGDTKQETFANITAVDYFFDSTHFSDLAQHFISNLLVKDGRKRLTVDQCLQHDWIKQNDSHLLSETVIQLTNNYQPQLINIKARNRWKLAYEIIKTCTRLARPIAQDDNHHESINSLVNSFPNHFYSEKQQDENFVLAALFGAVEEGNLNGLQELVNMSKIDINQANTHGETVVHVAAGLGQLEILKLLIKKGADFTLVDNHGDSAIYWAARQGHTQVIRYLYEKGLNVDSKNKTGETAVHVAARYGHADAIEQLCKCGANVNVADDHGETALHIAVWHGFPRIVHVLGEVGAQANVKNKEDETALHCAAARGHIESVRCLLEIGVDLNLLDKNGCTALHLSLRRHHIVVALMLINGGADFEIADSIGERPIHIAAREGLLSVCQSLCSLNCSVNVCNKSGLYPIHLAAKNGHIEIVRTLCLTSCMIDQKNRDGITAEISALAQGYKDIADLLVSIKNETIRSDYIQSLMPSGEPLTRVKLKLLGHSGVGKTTLVESLKCGYFSSWFRRSSRGVTTVAASAVVASLPSIGKRSVLSKNSMSSSKSSLDASPPLTPTTATSSSSSSAGSSSNGSSSSATSGIGSSTSSIATSSIAYGNGKHSTHGSIGAVNGMNGHFHGSFEFCSSLHHENSTRGIDVSTISPSGVGDLSIWDFSGCESYLQIYDHFLAETNCVHAILFRACDRLDIQMNQVLYWLHFLQSRLPVVEPLAFGGKSQFPAKVILIATHADLLSSRPNSHAYPAANNCASTTSSSVDFVNREVATVYQVVMEKFSNIFDIHDQVLIMDSHAVGSQAMKQFKNYLSTVKNKILEILPPSSGLLESVISALNHWRKALSNFPILTYSQLVSMIREQINPLTGEEHVNQIVRQLVSIGEIFYLKSKNDQDLIVLCPKWLTSTVIGNLLCEDQLMKSPISGRYTVDEIQDLFPSMDALDLLQVLESLSLCTQCDSEGDFISKDEHKNIEYEFPYFIKQERPESPLLIADSLEEHHHHHHAHHINSSSPGPPADGLESNNPNNTLMAGIRLQCDPDTPSGTLLTCLFPRLQTILRSLVQENNDIDNSLKLEQFCNTVKLHFGPLTATLMPAILSCSLQYEAIELRVVGPRSKPLDAFHFFYDLLSLIESSIGSMAPALLLHRHYMSPTELAKHKLHPLTYSPSQLIDVALRSSRPLEESLSITESSVLTTSSLISSVSSSCSSSVSPTSETGRFTGIGERLADIISFGCNNLNFDMDSSTLNLSSCTPAANTTSTNSAPTTLATNLAFAKSRDSYEFELRLNQTSGTCIQNVPPPLSSTKSSSPSHHLFQPQFYQLPMTSSFILPTINSNSSSGSTATTAFGPVSLNPTLAGELHINNLPVVTKQRLCALLDPPESMGKDWCMLGIKLGLTDKLPKLDPGNNTAISPTWRVLDECCRNPSCTISVLVAKLQELSRLDAVNLVLSSVPILKVFPLFSNMDSACPPLSDDASSAPISTVTRSASQASSSNLSR